MFKLIIYFYDIFTIGFCIMDCCYLCYIY